MYIFWVILGTLTLVFGTLGAVFGLTIDWLLAKSDTWSSPRQRAIVAILAPSLTLLGGGLYLALVYMPPRDKGELASGIGEGLTAAISILGCALMIIGCIIALSIRDRRARR